MIIEEIITINGKEFIHHYSDNKMKIKQDGTGAVYEDTYDVIPCPYTYMETNIPIDTPTELGEDEFIQKMQEQGVEFPCDYAVCNSIIASAVSAYNRSTNIRDTDMITED